MPKSKISQRNAHLITFHRTNVAVFMMNVYSKSAFKINSKYLKCSPFQSFYAVVKMKCQVPHA